MCVLIITIPFYVSGANVLNIVENSGEDGVNGYIRENDLMHFKVEAAIDGDSEISNDQVLFGMAGLEFECRPGSFYTGECEYTTTKDVRSDSERYLINLYADGWIPGDPAVKTLDNFLYIDRDAPRVTKVYVENSQPASDGRVVVSYTVSDSSGGGCTGIRNIEFYDNNLNNVMLRDSDHNLVIDGSPGDCTKSGFGVYTTGISFGPGKVCILPYDNFGQSAFELGTLPPDYDDVTNLNNRWCVEFDIDSNAPNVVGGSLKIIDENTGEEVNPGASTGYYNTGGRMVSIKVDIIEDGLATVYADFSQLNRDPPIAMSYQYLPLNLLTHCTDKDALNLRTCTWTNIQLNPDGDGNQIISITAIDNSFPPNEATQTVTRYFKLDNIGPLPTDISTLFYDSANQVTYSNASGNIFTADFSEDDSGLDAGGIELHLYDFPSSTPADNCTETSPGLWSCLWNNFPTKADSDDLITSEGIIEAYIYPSTSGDVLGNSVVQKYPEDVVFDLYSPVIDVADITKSSDNAFGFFSNDYELTIVAEVTDMSPVRATANLEDITVGAGEPSVQCVPTSGDVGETRTWQCTWITTIDTTLVDDVIVDLTFMDYVGYVSTSSTSIPITMEEETVIPDFFSFNFRTEYLVPIDMGIICNADCSEPYLASEFYFQHAPFYMEANGGTMNCPGTVTIVQDTDLIDGCQATYTMNEDKYIPGRYNGFITYPIDVDPLLMNLIADESESVTVAPACYLKFKVKCEAPNGTTVYAWPESKLITLNVPFVATGLSTPDAIEDFTDKIDRIEDDWEDVYRIVDTLNKILTYLSNICQIRGMITTLLQTINLIGIGLAAATDTGCEWCKAPELTMRGISGGTAIWWEEFQTATYLQTICSFVTCASRDTGADPSTVPQTAYDRDCKEASGGIACTINPKSFCDWLRVWALLGSYNLINRGGSGIGAGWATGLQSSVLDLSKRSLFFASACVCLPGIIYNIRKGIEFECWRGFCYRDLIPTGAVTKDDCDEQHNYNVCVYWMGEIAFLFDVLESPIAALATFLMNPLAMGWEIVRIGAYKMCRTASKAGPCTPGTCVALKWPNCALYLVWQTVTNIAEMTQWDEIVGGAMEWNWDDVKQGDQESYCQVLFDND